MSMMPTDDDYVTFQYDPAEREVCALKVRDCGEKVFRRKASSPEDMERLAADFRKFVKGLLLIRFGEALPWETDSRIFDLGEYVREHRSLFPECDLSDIGALWKALQLDDDIGDVAEEDMVLYQIAEIYIRAMTLSDPDIVEIHGLEELSDKINALLEPYHAFVELAPAEEDWFEDKSEAGNTWADADFEDGFGSGYEDKWMEVGIMEYDASKNLVGFAAIPVGAEGGGMDISEEMRYCKLEITVE